MKTDKQVRDEDDNGLLNAVLADDNWHALNGGLKQQALAAMAQARRRRHLRVQIGQAALVVMLLGSLAWWFHHPASRTIATVATPDSPRPTTHQDRFISEEEMLALFPAGSCVVAEIDGRKELVFFDAEAARKGFVRK